MIKEPIVSVLMTSYNREKYIEDSIKSVLASTFTDFELIIVDDCSSDRTVEIASKYMQTDPRVKVFVNESNLGQFRNRNKTVSLAKGQYIKFLDSDDLIYPTGLQVLVEMMDKYPNAGYGLCSLSQDDKRIYPFQLSSSESYEYNYFYRSIFHKAPLSSIIRKSAFDRINGFEIEAVCGDFAFWLKIASYFPVVLIPDGVVWYREHAEGEMQKARENSLISFEYLIAERLYIEQTTFLAEEIKSKLRNINIKKSIIFLMRLVLKFRIHALFQIWIKKGLKSKEYFIHNSKILD